MNRRIAIIGNGIAGITAARFIRKMSHASIVVISDESEHFYSRTALMYLYMGHMSYPDLKPYEDWFWPKNRIELVRGYVSRVDVAGKRLLLTSGNTIGYDALILATGSRTRRFGWPGQDLKGVQGLYGLQDLQLMEENTRGIERGVIVGGGLIGVEMAEMLRSRGIGVTMLAREAEYWNNVLPAEECRLIGRHIRSHGVDLRLSTELAGIRDGGDGRVGSVLTNAGEEIACGFVGITTGVTPNVDFLRGSGIEVDAGVLVNDAFETNVPDVYAVGDCAQFNDVRPGHPPIEQLWYTGRMHGETVARTICGTRTVYDRGVWFNSAKFFDIEYQTYGFVASCPREGEDSLYWEDSSGGRAIRIVWRKEDEVVVGVNLLGLRHSQSVWETWLRTGATIEHVLENLAAANFDPEFTTLSEPAIVAAYSRRTGRSIAARKKRGWGARRVL